MAMASWRGMPPCQMTPGVDSSAARIREDHSGSSGTSWILSPTMWTSAEIPCSASKAGSRVISSVFHRGANLPV